MRRRPVHSSMLAAVGYDTAAGTLEVEFSSGAVYRYYRVPPAVYRGLLSAPSHGRYFNAHVRECYRYERLAEPS